MAKENIYTEQSLINRLVHIKLNDLQLDELTQSWAKCMTTKSFRSRWLLSHLPTVGTLDLSFHDILDLKIINHHEVFIRVGLCLDKDYQIHQYMRT